MSPFHARPADMSLRSVLLLLAIFGGGAVLLPTSSLAIAPAQVVLSELDESADSLSATAVAFRLRYGTVLPRPPASSPAPSRDRWLARDKAKHVAFSALWTVSTQYVLVNKANWSEADALPVSMASAAAVGVAKELYDASRPDETASGKDLVADALGIGLAIGLVWL